MVEGVPTQKDLFPSKGYLCVGLGFFPITGEIFVPWHFCRGRGWVWGNCSIRPQEMGWWEVGLMQQWWHSVVLSSQPPAPCPPTSQTSSWEAAGAEHQLSHRALFCSILSTQEWRLIPPLFLLLLYKIQRGCGLPPASTGEDLPNTGINPALLSTLWALAQLNHHFHTIKQKNSKHTIKKPFYNPMYTHTVNTSLTPFALFFVFWM